MKLALFLLSLVLALVSARAEEFVKATQVGTASWYGAEFRKTASGEGYKSSSMTAAHRTLPLGTLVRVENLANGRSVTVRINDRGPFCKGRIIDVSNAAARRLEMIRSGTTKVKIQVVKQA